MSNIMEELQQHACDGTQSPMFEPTCPESNVPEAFMIATPTTVSTSSTSPKKSPYIAKLQAIEANAEAAIASWNLSTTGSVVPAKRPVSQILTESDDEDDEGDTVVPPFDPAHQCRPKLPLYHPGFQQSERDIQSIIKVFIDFLGNTADEGIGGEEAKYLKAQALQNHSISYEEKLRFAVTGDTGSGKSATTNALLGNDLTPEGDSGSACTNVVTEFCQKKLSTNIGAVQAEVQFYCLEYCINSLVTIWFKQWFDTQQRMMRDEDDIDDEDRARKDAALECLEHLFAHRVAPDSLEDFMSSGKSSKDNSVLSTLLKWTVEIHEQFVRDGELCVSLTSSTHEDMREQLRPFRMRALNARFMGKSLSFSPWPFVKIIRYYVDSPLLQDGICLADVPGTKDINVYRVEAALAYLQRCEKTIVVVDIKRATSDQSFRQHYINAHRRRQHGSVILVATRSDEMNDDGGSILELDDIAEEKLASVEEKLTQLTGETEVIEEEIRANRSDFQHFKGLKQEGTSTEDNCSKVEELRVAYKALITRKKLIHSEVALLEKERRDIRIACRSRLVAAKLSRMYSQNTGDDAGAASFCVSNRMYMRYRRGYNNTNPDKVPTMKLEDTNIPALFKYISGQPSQGKVAVLENTIQFKIPMLLSIFQMSCSKSTEARVEHVTNILDRTIKGIDSKIKKMAEKCRETFLNALVTDVSSLELQDKFDKNAAKILEDLGKMNAASHRALVRKKGKYCQKKLGINFDLNAKLLSAVTPTIESAFRAAIETGPLSFTAQAAQTIKTSFGNLNKTLKDDPQALVGDAYQTCFGNNLAGYEKHITAKVEKAKKKLRLGLIEVDQKAGKSTEGGYLHDAMDPIYTQAELERPKKGQKLKDVRHQYLKEKTIGLQGPFPDIAEWVKEEINDIITETCEKLSEDVVSMLKTIRVAFERQKQRKEHDTLEGQRFRKELHELVAEASRILEGVVVKSLEKCKEYK